MQQYMHEYINFWYSKPGIILLMTKKVINDKESHHFRTESYII